MLGTIRKCYNSGDITGTIVIPYGVTSGITSVIQNGLIEQCYNIGNITTITEFANCRACGIFNGYVSYASKIISCYNTGTVKIISKNVEDTCPVAGGIGGQSDLGEDIVENCYNIGQIIIDTAGINEDLRRAGILGYVGLTTKGINNCYWLTGTANKGIGEIADTEEEDPTVEIDKNDLKTLAKSLGDDFINVDGQDYPILKWQLE